VEPVSAPWFILPIALLPVLTGIAFAGGAEPEAG
jgi:hypothetical protein